MRSHYKRLCNVTLDAPFESGSVTKLAPGFEKQCENFNKTICETKYKEKEIERDLQVTLMKAVPETTCESVLIEEEICMTPQCPLVFHNKICEAKERSYVAIVPKVIKCFTSLLLTGSNNQF